MTQETQDPRWPKRLDKSRNFLWYVADKDKPLLKDLLRTIPQEQAPSFSAAVMEAVRSALEVRREDTLGKFGKDLREYMDSLQVVLDKASPDARSVLTLFLWPQINALFHRFLADRPENLIGRSLSSEEHAALFEVEGLPDEQTLKKANQKELERLGNEMLAILQARVLPGGEP